MDLNSVELFTGAGGLAIGLERAGFHHKLLVENNIYANKTIKFNKSNSIYTHWDLFEDDVRKKSFNEYNGEISLVAGGPPCQPFSIGGKGKGSEDRRDLFPEAVRIVNEIQPKAFIFENVKGLLRPSFSNYLEYILLQLQFPNVRKENFESLEEHLSRLEEIKTSGKYSDIHYNIVFRCLNAANYGIPQKRERVFIVGFRDDLDLKWSFPLETHGFDELLWDKWITMNYWRRHNIDADDLQLRPSKSELKRLNILKRTNFQPKLEPWKTIRDAISDLPNPERINKLSQKITNHEFKSGAKAYIGHTGSYLDEPSKTLKAGAHGVPGGENMIHFYNETFRYFTVRESARIQTFPDNYQFLGSWGEAMRQIGNAVPVELARIVGSSVYDQIISKVDLL